MGRALRLTAKIVQKLFGKYGKVLGVKEVRPQYI